jgi:hypothetical protein
MPANSVLVTRDSPRSAGFSRISTRRFASSALIRPPDSITSVFTSPKCQIAGAQRGDGSSVMSVPITVHSGVMWCLAMRA